MPNTTITTFDQFVIDSLRYYWGRTGIEPDETEGGILLSQFEAIGFREEQRSFETQKAIENGIIQAAASIFGLSVEGSVAAQTSIAYSRSTLLPSDTLIPAGRRVQTPSGVEFKTLADVTVLAGVLSSPAIPVQASVPGDSGNVSAGSLTVFVDTVPGFETVTNAVKATGGQNAESNDDLSVRIQRAISQLGRGIKNGIESVALATADANGTKAAQVLAWDKYFDATIPNGITRVYVYRPGTPPTTLLDAILAALQSSQRVLGVSLEVYAVTAQTQTIAATIYGTDSLAQAKAVQAVYDFINAIPIGVDLDYMRLGSAIKASDPSIYSVTVTTPTANVTVPKYFKIEVNGTPNITFVNQVTPP